MLAFHCAVSGLMVGRNKLHFCAEDPVEVEPEASLVGVPIVTKYFLWGAIPAEPAPDEAIADVLGGGRGESYGLKPTSPAADNGEDVSHSF